ncbi:MAG: T9SS type B sorting domain-containing protein [Roseivirga sp.]|nr:T9SS type B sorting domain-containing protein [Roseivirga sp.]
MRRKLLLTVITFLCLFQVSIAQVTTEGTDFWFGFLQNADTGTPASMEIFITSNQVAKGTIEVFADGRKIDFEITPGVTFKENIGTAVLNPYAASGSGVVQKKGFHITSDVDISVYAFNNRQFSADAAVIFPTNSLGKKYYASTYYEEAPADDAWTSQNSPSELLIVATADDTRVEITPSEDTEDGKPKGSMFTVDLNQGDIYQLTSIGDLTGTLIESSSASDECKNFAVFGGNRWTRVTGGQNCLAFNSGGGGAATLSGGFAGDQLYEQMYPVKTWGRRYSAIPYKGRTGYVLQITASENDTRVEVDGQPSVTLNEGEFQRYDMTNAALVNADKPIQVAQLSQSLSCDFAPGTSDPAGPGDPFMIMLSPNEQFLKRITFNALEATQITDYFVSVIVRTSDIDQLTLNGVAVAPSLFFGTPGDRDFSYATININRGEDYTLDSESGFIAYIYGFGQVESFGYVAGASLENLNLQLIGDDETIGLIVDEGCVNSLVDFKVDFEVKPGEIPRFNTFNWFFGDGNEAEGEEVAHTYDAPGTYEIQLIASDGGGACGNSETVTRFVVITETSIDELTGPASVCPDVTDIAYSVSGAADNTYEWLIEGGTITSAATGDNITVDWHGANDNAFIKVIPTNYLGCKGDTVTLDVKINKRLEPALPAGDIEVCFTDLASVVYSTPPTNGSAYQWFIDGGTILSGENTEEVTVSWDGPGVGSIWYLESNLLISDCDGESERLQVTVYDEITETGVVSNVLCNAGNTGEISLSIAGGKDGGYNVSWDNGMSGADINGLVAGTYTATITDPLGCTLEAIYTVTEPDVLEITAATVMDVRCFQESNGSIDLTVAGGTPDAGGLYSYIWTGPATNTTTTEPMIEGLITGDYSVLVRDENGCETTMNFFVAEPPLLEPDLETLINEPICPNASDGTAFVDAKGGTPDYQFFWSNNETVDQQQGENFSRGTYTVRIVDANGCETSLQVEVEERFPKIFVPNAFSPNGDGQNDEFRPVTDCQLVYSMQIFNQWGAITFATNDIFEGWDGTQDGQNVPDGKYSYVIFYSGSLNGISFEETLRGTLRLYR